MPCRIFSSQKFNGPYKYPLNFVTGKRDPKVTLITRYQNSYLSYDISFEVHCINRFPVSMMKV